MFENIPLLSLLLIVPLVGAIATFLLGNNPKVAKYIALVFSAITLVTVGPAADELLPQRAAGDPFQFEEQLPMDQRARDQPTTSEWTASAYRWCSSARCWCFLAILFSWDVEETDQGVHGPHAGAGGRASWACSCPWTTSCSTSSGRSSSSRCTSS